MHDEIKRRLLREVVQDNLATTLGPTTASPRAPLRWRVTLGSVLMLTVALVLLPLDDLATVISTVFEQRGEVVRSPRISAQRPATPPSGNDSAMGAAQRLAGLEPQGVWPGPAPVEAPPLAAEEEPVLLDEGEGAELLLAAPVPIDLAVIPLRVKKIVLDPGHGGKDVGTSIPTGLTEKEVTLDIGRRLRRLLERDDFEVFMTRDSDETVPLAQRTALANAQGADLFVSIHINWIDRSHARGMETYYLGPTEDPRLLQLAAQENHDSGYSLADFRRLLDGIYLSVRREESRRLAETVQRTLVRSVHPKNPALVNRGVKTAPFAVLVGTEMPAILAEVACLSNAAEAQLLATPQYRQSLAQALFRGIRAYTETLNRPPKKGS